MSIEYRCHKTSLCIDVRATARMVYIAALVIIPMPQNTAQPTMDH